MKPYTLSISSNAVRAARLLKKVSAHMDVSVPRSSLIDMAGAMLLLLLAAIHGAVYLAFALTPAYPGGLFLANSAIAVVLAVALALLPWSR